MRAAVYTEFGPPEVLKIEDVPKPEPGNNEVLIKIKASSVGFGDIFARDFKKQRKTNFNMPSPLKLVIILLFGANKPKIKILGAEFSGVVEKVGSRVQNYKAGDEVFGYRGQEFCCNAEYISVPEKSCFTHKPKSMSFLEAAAAPYGSIMAHTLLKKVTLKKGDSVLIIGASGGIGSTAVQLAKNVYNAHVTGVCGTNRVNYVTKLGADSVIDYQKEDYSKSSGKYDLIIDILGRGSFTRCKDLLSENGIYFRSSFKTRNLLEMMFNNIFNSKKIICAMAGDSVNDLKECVPLIEDKKIRTIIDKTFSLEQIADAHRYYETGQHKGKVVVTID